MFNILLPSTSTWPGQLTRMECWNKTFCHLALMQIPHGLFLQRAIFLCCFLLFHHAFSSTNFLSSMYNNNQPLWNTLSNPAKLQHSVPTLASKGVIRCCLVLSPHQPPSPSPSPSQPVNSKQVCHMQACWPEEEEEEEAV